MQEPNEQGDEQSNEEESEENDPFSGEQNQEENEPEEQAENIPLTEQFTAPQFVERYSGYSSPPLGCFILFTFSLVVLSFFFLGTAFQRQSFLANSKYYLRNSNFKMFHLGDEIADMKISMASISWTLKLDNVQIENSTEPPLYVNNSWDLGTVNIPYKVDRPLPYALELKYDSETFSYLLPVIEENGSFYVEKPLYISFLATPSGDEQLRPAEPKYVDKFIGYSPISIKIFSTEAPEIAHLDYGPSGSVDEFTLFIILFIVGVVLTVALLMFAVYALQIIEVSNTFVVRASGGQLLRKYDDPVEIKENERVPLFN